MYKLYVIPGSHACRSAMLMLEHKRVPYRRVDVRHPHPPRRGPAARVRRGRRDARARADGARSGCASAIASAPCRRSPPTANGSRRTTRIARFLDERHPEPPLFPADAERRAAVEEAERWANETLQMAARRIAPARRCATRGDQPLGRRRSDGLPPLPARARAAPDHPADRRAASSPSTAAAETSSSPSFRRCSTGSTPGSPTGCSAARSRTPPTSWSRPAWR